MDLLGRSHKPDPGCVCCEGVGYVDHGQGMTDCPCVQMMLCEAALLEARDRLRGAVEALDAALYHAGNLQAVLDHKPVRDLCESRAAAMKAAATLNQLRGQS